MEHKLMAVALRTVTIFGIHAYAIGVYFEESTLNSKDTDKETLMQAPYVIRICTEFPAI